MAIVATFSTTRPGLVAKRTGGVDAVTFGTVTGDGGAYVSGGFAVAAALFGLDTVDHVVLNHPDTATVSARYVKSTGKILLYLEDVISGIAAEFSGNYSGNIDLVVYGTKVA